MSILFFSGETEGAGKQIQRIIEAQVRDDEIEIYRTIESLSSRLKQTAYNLGIAVLFAANKEALSGFLSIRNLFDDVRIILILPDGEEDTIRKGHLLRPRFLKPVDSNFNDVALVLNKMIRSLNQKPFLQTPIKEEQYGH